MKDKDNWQKICEEIQDRVWKVTPHTFPDGYPTRFIRYDLNLPSHNNEKRGMRFHLHPGNDDFMIHSPPMSPLEILNLFLYGLAIPQRPRSK